MSRFEKVISSLLLISLFVPLIAFAAGIRSPNYSKEPLSPLPAFEVSHQFGVDFDRWWSRHFPFRSTLVTFYHRALCSLFNDSGSDQVVKGRGGWYYFAPTTKDYVRSEHLSEGDCRKIAQSLAIQRHAAEQGDRVFLVCFAPNKSTVYPEFMPKWVRVVGSKRPLERLKAVMPDGCYLEEVLIRAKDTSAYNLYHPEDTHWNLLGSSIAYKEIMERLSLEERTLSLGSPCPVDRGWEADLTNMLFPAVQSSDEQVLFPCFEKDYLLKRPIRTSEDPAIETINPKNENTVLMFRDSFANAWIDFFSSTFHTVHYSRILPYRYSLLSEVNPDFVILELAERNLDYLLQMTPELIAPEAFPVEGDFRRADCVTSKLMCEKRNGLYFYNFLPRDSSWAETVEAVQLFDGQMWYEAFPIFDDGNLGDGIWQYGFSLYMPQSVNWQALRYRRQKVWYEAALAIE